MKSLAALLIVTTLATSIPQAEASPSIYSLLAPKDPTKAQTINQDCPKAMDSGQFAKLLGEYPKVYHDKSAALEQWDLEDQITNAVFCSVGTPQYVNYLQIVNDVAASDTDAYYNLAKRLQAHWQTQYAVAITKTQQQRMQNVADKSMMLSLLVTALSLFSKNTSQVPNLFSIVRQLFPAAIPLVAVGGTEAINRYGLLEGRYPISPAHVMKFPLPQENTAYDWYDINKNVASAVASVAGAQAASWIVGGLTDAITVGKFSFNPATILASFAIGYGVQKGSQYTIDVIHYHNLVKNYLKERDNVARAVANKDLIGMRTSAENFKNAAIILSSFIDQPSVTVWVDFDQDVQSIGGDGILDWKLIARTDIQFYTGKTPEYFFPDSKYKQQKVAQYSQQRDEKLETIQAAEDPVSLQDVELEIALNVMESSDTNIDQSVNLLKGDQQSQAKLIEEGFESYKQSKAPVVEPESELYKEYLAKLDQERDTLLVQELMDGKVYRNPSHVLLQAAAYIHSLNQPVLSSVSDDLLNIIFSGELFK